jgi:hypothetical protein
VPPGAGVPPERPWVRWALIALGVVAVALVILAIILVTRPPKSAPPQAVATATPSPSASPTPTATPAPTPTPTPTPKPTPTPAPLTPTQQANLLFPTSGTECGANGDYSGCPVTTNLITDATRWRSAQPSTRVPLCRCQSTYSSPVATEDKTAIPAGDQGNPSFDAVDVTLVRTPGGNQTMVVVLVRQGNGTWLADDTYCDNPQNRLSAGNPQTC